MRHVFARQKTLKRVVLFALLFASPLLVAAAPPTVSITNTGYVTATPTVIGFTVDDLSASVTCGIDGGAQSVCTGTSTHTLNLLSDGSHTLRIEATNTGNEVGFREATFIKDTISPYISVFSYSTTLPTSGNVRVVIGSYSEQPGQLINFSSDTRVFTENGSFTYYFTDLAGNAGSSTVTVSNIDREVPVIISEPYDTVPTNKPITVTVSATDKNAFTLSTTTHTFAENGSFTFVATDILGNTATSTVTVTNIDTEPPVLVLNGAEIFSARVGSKINDLGASVTDNVDSSSTVYTTDAFNTDSPGTLTLTYTATDTAGNSSSITRTLEVQRAPSSGGGGKARPQAPVSDVATDPVGQVLGVSTYNFTRNLSQKDTGEDVTALQEILISLVTLMKNQQGILAPKPQWRSNRINLHAEFHKLVRLARLLETQ